MILHKDQIVRGTYLEKTLGIPLEDIPESVWGFNGRDSMNETLIIIRSIYDGMIRSRRPTELRAMPMYRVYFNEYPAGLMQYHGDGKKCPFPRELYNYNMDTNFFMKDQAIDIAKRLKAYILEKGNDYFKPAVGRGTQTNR